LFVHLGFGAAKSLVLFSMLNDHLVIKLSFSPFVFSNYHLLSFVYEDSLKRACLLYNQIAIPKQVS